MRAADVFFSDRLHGLRYRGGPLHTTPKLARRARRVTVLPVVVSASGGVKYRQLRREYQLCWVVHFVPPRVFLCCCHYTAGSFWLARDGAEKGKKRLMICVRQGIYEAKAACIGLEPITSKL